jgi:hypothetical protein
MTVCARLRYLRCGAALGVLLQRNGNKKMNQPNAPSTVPIQPQPPRSGEGRHESAAHPTWGQGSIAGDILHGAEAIAEFLYGDPKHRRRVYNLIDAGRLPHFRLGMGICARKSVLMAWIKSQEETPPPA